MNDNDDWWEREFEGKEDEDYEVTFNEVKIKIVIDYPVRLIRTDTTFDLSQKVNCGVGEDS